MKTFTHKSINCPSWRNISIDMPHIMEQHHSSGSAYLSGSKNSMFPEHLSERQIESIVIQAYSKAERIHSQGDRIKMRSFYKGVYYELWVNTDTRRIETCYPVE